jgi:hypothetical protein
VHRLGAGLLGGREDRLDVQVALAHRRRTDPHRLVAGFGVHRSFVGVAVDGDRGDAHPLAGARDAHRDLAPVGDQDLSEHARAG